MKRRKYRPRQRPLTEAEVAELWTRRAAGESGTRIARHMGRNASSLRAHIHEAGGIRPRPRKRSGMSLSLQEREEISRGLAAADSLRSIAVRIGRSASTVSREVTRNRGRQDYRADNAEQAALNRGRRPKPAKLTIHSRLWAEVVARLEANWSPQQISRSLKEEYPGEPSMQVSHETIYLSLYVQGRGLLRKELTKHLRRRHQIRQPKQHETSSRGKIKDMINISERPAEAADRAVPGNWEGDLLLGTPTTAIGTLVERSTRFVMLFKLPSGINAESARIGLTQKILTLPQNLRRSLAWDQGREMKEHVRFTIDTGVQVYFCDPASPWQRGSNENTNGLLRQYFPRGKSVAHYTQEELDRVAAQLNDRPRETLNWKSPAWKLTQVLQESSAAGVAPTA
ncbi:MAG TPA: IS30 family transposase [Candidatus Dormibacteraeota bacterium]|nr:IS30 family transposase [Candidatus Dormibacteraeota bacterium]